MAAAEAASVEEEVGPKRQVQLLQPNSVSYIR